MKKVVIDEDIDSDSFGGGGFYCRPAFFFFFFPMSTFSEMRRVLAERRHKGGRERERAYAGSNGKIKWGNWWSS